MSDRWGSYQSATGAYWGQLHSAGRARGRAATSSAQLAEDLASLVEALRTRWQTHDDAAPAARKAWLGELDDYERQLVSAIALRDALAQLWAYGTDPRRRADLQARLSAQPAAPGAEVLAEKSASDVDGSRGPMRSRRGATAHVSAKPAVSASADESPAALGASFDRTLSIAEALCQLVQGAGNAGQDL